MTIRELFRINPFRFVIIFLMGAVNAGGAVFSGYALTWQFNAIKNKNWQVFLIATLLQVIVLLISYYFSSWGKYLWSKQVQQMNHKIRLELADHYFSDQKFHKVSGVQNQMINDLNMIKNDYANSWLLTFQYLATVVGVSFALLTFNWFLFILSLIVAAAQILMPKVIEKPLKKAAQKVSDSNRQYLKDLGYWLIGISELKRYLAGNKLFEVLSQSSKELEKAREDKQATDSFLDFINQITYTFGDLLLFMLTGYLVIHKLAQFGLISGIGNFNWYLFSSLMGLANLLGRIKGTKTINQRLLTNRKQLQEKKNRDVAVVSEFSTNNLKIQFDNGEQVAFPNVKVRSGEKILLTGDSGVGKSTLFKLLLGELKPTTGKIHYFDEMNKEVIPDLSKIGYLPQNPVLYPVSIADNIMMFDHHLRAKLKAAIERVQLAPDIAKFPDGVETEINLDKLNISGGQRQKIVLARSQIHDSKLLLIDEGTSAIDQKATIKILQKLVKTDATIVFIAHNFNPTMIKLFDREIHLEKTVV